MKKFLLLATVLLLAAAPAWPQSLVGYQRSEDVVYGRKFGTALTLACRPERLVPAPAGTPHAIPAEVEDVIFLGAASKLLLRVDGQVLSALVDRPRLEAPRRARRTAGTGESLAVIKPSRQSDLVVEKSRPMSSSLPRRRSGRGSFLSRRRSPKRCWKMPDPRVVQRIRKRSRKPMHWWP